MTAHEALAIEDLDASSYEAAKQWLEKKVVARRLPQWLTHGLVGWSALTYLVCLLNLVWSIDKSTCKGGSPNLSWAIAIAMAVGAIFSDAGLLCWLVNLGDINMEDDDPNDRCRTALSYLKEAMNAKCEQIQDDWTKNGLRVILHLTLFLGYIEALDQETDFMQPGQILSCEDTHPEEATAYANSWKKFGVSFHLSQFALFTLALAYVVQVAFLVLFGVWPLYRSRKNPDFIESVEWMEFHVTAVYRFSEEITKDQAHDQVYNTLLDQLYIPHRMKIESSNVCEWYITITTEDPIAAETIKATAANISLLQESFKNADVDVDLELLMAHTYDSLDIVLHKMISEELAAMALLCQGCGVSAAAQLAEAAAVKSAGFSGAPALQETAAKALAALTSAIPRVLLEACPSLMVSVSFAAMSFDEASFASKLKMLITLALSYASIGKKAFDLFSLATCQFKARQVSHDYTCRCRTLASVLVFFSAGMGVKLVGVSACPDTHLFQLTSMSCLRASDS